MRRISLQTEFEIVGYPFNIQFFDDCAVAHIPTAATNDDVDIGHAAAVLVNKIIDIALAENLQVIVLLNIEENADSDGMRLWCDCLTKHINSTKFVSNYLILTNSTFQHAEQYDNVLSIWWFLHQAISTYTKDNIENLTWKPSNSKVLFLPGKLWKPSRFPALYYFLHSSISDSLKYACMTYEQMEHWSEHSEVKLFEAWATVYDNQPHSFDAMRSMVNNIAKVIDRPWANEDFDMLPPELYNDVAVEIVAETSASSLAHVTEKTFKPIVLGYPFVYIHPQFVNKLTTLGFKLYQPDATTEWLPHAGVNKDIYPYNRNTLSEFKTCVDNTQKVLNNIENLDLEYIQGRITYNQEHAMKIHQQTINNITDVIPGFNSYADDFFAFATGTNNLLYNKRKETHT